MPSVYPRTRHHCRCMCALCEHSGGGAFGLQPDGGLPLYVVTHEADAIGGVAPAAVDAEATEYVHALQQPAGGAP
jgi:hypothetical protein